MTCSSRCYAIGSVRLTHRKPAWLVEVATARRGLFDQLLAIPLAGAPTWSARSLHTLLASVRLHGLLDLLLDGFEVEARTLLHRRKLDRRLGELADLLLHELEPPELEDKPVVVCQRSLIAAWQAGAFERIKPNVGEDWPIDLDRAS